MNILELGERPVDHVAVAVPSIDIACALFQSLSGVPCSDVEVLDSQGVRVAFCGQIELLEPLAPDTTVGRFLDRRGPGLHHLAYRSPDIEDDLRRLAAAGFRLIDQSARPGAGGHQVAFLHPESTGGILVELVERS